MSFGDIDDRIPGNSWEEHRTRSWYDGSTAYDFGERVSSKWNIS